MKIDRIIITCTMCKDVRTFDPSPMIQNAIALRFYMDDVIGACPKCGHQDAEVKARDRDPSPRSSAS